MRVALDANCEPRRAVRRIRRRCVGPTMRGAAGERSTGEGDSIIGAPAAAPTPALEYLLLPELEEMSPGNPIEAYFKCYLEQYRFTVRRELVRNSPDAVGEPLEELPPDEPRETWPFRSGSRLTGPLGSTTPTGRSFGSSRPMAFAYACLPDLQANASPGRAMFSSLSEPRSPTGRVDDAMRSAKTLFAMARHMDEHPS